MIFCVLVPRLHLAITGLPFASSAVIGSTTGTCSDVFRFTASWQGIDMCFRCPAKSKGAARDLYHNLGPDCAWVHEEFNLAQFISRRLKDRHLSILIVFSELLMVFVHGLETMNLKKKG